MTLVTTRVPRFYTCSPKARVGWLRLWVENVPEPISEQIKSQNRQSDREPREQAQPVPVVDVVLAFRNHQPPLRRWRWYADSQEAQSSFEENQLPGDQRGHHDYRTGDIRKNVPSHNSERRATGNTRKVDITERFYSEHIAANHSRKLRRDER